MVLRPTTRVREAAAMRVEIDASASFLRLSRADVDLDAAKTARR
jgi:hypothetical protein